MSKAELFLVAREKGLNWLLKQRHPNGAIGPYEKGIGCYYRAPWTFAVTGRGREASMVLNWIRRNMFSTDGDFAGSYPRTDYDSYYLYPNANIIFGAQIMRQFDLSTRGMRFLLRMQDRDSGGFYNRRDQTGPSGKQDLWYNSQVGLTCIVTGHIDEAKKVASFAKKVYELQPEIEDRLYNVYSPSDGLVTEFPEDEAKSHVVEASEPRQYYFQPGIAAAFLSRMHMATSEPTYLELARKYIEFAMRCEHLYSAPQCCKVGWGAALLYQITKETRYYDLAMNVAEYLLDHQHPEGYWLNVEPHTAYKNVVEITEEFVVHLDTILSAIVT